MENMLSLKDVCLNLIVQNFERFYIAFTVSNNEIFKRNFEILQRKFAFELLSELFRKDKLKGEYLDLFLNKYLEIFDCGWLDSSPYEYCIENIFRCLPNLTKIYCYEINDEILENIAKFCPKIVEIDAVISNVTDNGVKYLCRKKNGNVPCPKLKNLFVDGNMVTNEAVKHVIQDLTSLERLDYYHNLPKILYSLHNADLPKLENVCSYNFVELNLLLFLYCPYYSDLLKICLSVCPKLKTVTCAITKEEQLTFFNNKCVEYIMLRFSSHLKNINITNFLNNNGNSLTVLKIDTCIMSVSELAASCPKLMILRTDDVTFQMNDNSLFVFDCLKGCFFTRIKNDNATHKAICLLLSSSPNLEYLLFASCDLSPDIKICILKCCENYRLKEIYFTHMKNVEMDFVKQILLNCTSLTNLDLEGCDHSIEERKELIKFSKTLPNKPQVYF